MKGKICAILTCVLLAGHVCAEPFTPARGSAARDAILATARAIAGYDLGAPIEFVVDHMMVDGDVAFLSATAQRPGGVPIDLEKTPMVVRDGDPPSLIDGPVLVMFLKQVNGHWYIDDFSIGATDVWWIGDPFCKTFATVMPDYGCPR